MIIVTPFVFQRLPFQNVFSPHEKKNSVFSYFSGLKIVFGKLRTRFRDVLVLTVGLTEEKELRFQYQFL